ncbi:4'-phosphopantetheinyl transferase superfamily protein [Streptomyces sp. AM 2-1-1]|uniref:4'-phosphopantetheinyl transferase family protein n=1 Tax=Streptomyces sp. AM 2-1-1 TaxID=3028709 RepID=UPI0023B8F9F1|nr:4'-phosphopantetheinyl transferase superfamily protein [Streptomyces sp. AM 2-1-1]WEH40479.1 4'-phosphopantetheinyl transferase superfamily protein [Streptomyces sp. AM 2-1-1]
MTWGGTIAAVRAAPSPSSLFLACDLRAPGVEEAAGAILGRLSAADLERVARLRAPADRTRSVMARWLALHAASRLLERPWTSLRLGRRPRGGLYVTAQPSLSLSVAHSGRYAVAAAALGGRVGVDVEQVARVAALPDSAFLTPAESSALALTGPSPDGRAALWALKEAATKLTGEGLRAGMRHVGFQWSGPPGTPGFARTPYTPGAFTTCSLPGGYVSAVGVTAGTPPTAPVFLSATPPPNTGAERTTFGKYDAEDAEAYIRLSIE